MTALADAAWLAELQHRNAAQLREAVLSARQEGATWRDIADEVGLPHVTLYRQVQSGGPVVVIHPYHVASSRWAPPQ